MGNVAARQSALDRWTELVRARREQMEPLIAGLGGPPEDWWGDRAASFARGLGDLAATLPFGAAGIADRLGRGDTLLDIGAGAGRYAVPLSRTLAHVTLVEPSPAMAERARSGFAAVGRDNYTLIEREWPRARVPAHTAVLMANVLAQTEDLAGFLRPALARAASWLFLVHGTVNDGGEETIRLFERFHGTPRVANPVLGDLLPALHELGIHPDVVMGTRRFQRSYADVAEAARATAANALVPQTPDVLRRIRRMLRGRLRPTDDGRLLQAPRDVPLAFMTWRIPV